MLMFRLVQDLRCKLLLQVFMWWLSCGNAQTCFGDSLEVRFEDGSIPLPAEGEGDQHHIPRGGELHDRGRT